MVRIHCYRELEPLIEALAAWIKQRKDPLQAISIVLSPLNLKSWIEQQLMHVGNIVANVHYCSPIEDLLGRLHPSFPIPRWDRQAVHARLMQAVMRFCQKALPDDIPDDLKSYLLTDLEQGTGVSARQLELANSFAHWLIDEMESDPIRLVQWVESPLLTKEGQSWQAILWRKLVEQVGWKDLVTATPLGLLKFTENVVASSFQSASLLVLIGDVLPEVQAWCYQWLAKIESLHVLAWNLSPFPYQPSLDCNIKRAIFRNRFLSVHQKQRKQLQQWAASDGEIFFEEEKGDFSISTHLNFLKKRALSSASDPAWPVKPFNPEDQSLRIRGAASILREVEGAKDWILEKLSQDSTLRLRDFCVVVPDLEKYGPILRSVFHAFQIGPKLEIGAWSQMRRTRIQIQQTLFYFLKTIEKPRVTLSQWFEGVNRLEGWNGFFEDPQIFQYLIQNCLENWVFWTEFAFPLEQLFEQLLSFTAQCMGEGFSGARPLLSADFFFYHHHFFTLIEKWAHFHAQISKSRSFRQWHCFLKTMFNDWFDPRSEISRQWLPQWDSWIGRERLSQNGDEEIKITYSGLLRWLQKQLPQAFTQQQSLLKDAIPCCSSYSAFRGVHFEHCLILGANQGNYCDRAILHYEKELSNARQEIKSLLYEGHFLERCLMAKKSVYFSFIDSSDPSNAPSSLLKELLSFFWLLPENLESGAFALPSVPFDPQAFSDKPGLKSYAQLWFLPERSATPSLKTLNFTEESASPYDQNGTFESIALTELMAFFSNPVIHWLNRHNAHSPKIVREVPLSHQQRNRRLAQRRRVHLFQWLEKTGLDKREKIDEKEILQALQRERWLANDLWGDSLFQSEITQLQKLYRRLRDLEVTRQDRWLSMDSKTYVLYGQSLLQWGEKGIFKMAFGAVRVNDLLQTWLLHLLNAVQHPGENDSALLGYNGDLYEFCSIDSTVAQTYLDRCVHLLRNNQLRPLPFFLESAGAWTSTFIEEEHLLKQTVHPTELDYFQQQPSQKAWKAFDAVYHGGFHSAGEVSRPGGEWLGSYHHFELNALENLMRAVLAPMYHHLTHKDGARYGSRI